MHIRSKYLVCGLVLLLGSSTTQAWAQTRSTQARPAQTARQPRRAKGPPKWNLEIFGGGMMHMPTAGGDAIGTFPTGATFVAQNGLNSRSVSSWYFGDGALLFSQVQSDFASRFNVRYPVITPADPVLQSGGAHRGTGADIGVRVSRILSKKYALEIGLDHSLSKRTLDFDAKTGLEATSASFIAGFTGLLGTMPQTGAHAISTVTVGEPAGGQTTVTGSILIGLTSGRKWSTHATTGVGGVFNAGQVLDVKLTGGYDFSFLGTFPISETDVMTVHFKERKNQVVGVLGGGFVYAMSARGGLQVDFRVILGAGGSSTSVDAAPGNRTTPPTTAIPSNTTPSIQFSTIPGVRSSLGGAMQELVTFSASGLDARAQLTVGYVVKF